MTSASPRPKLPPLWQQCLIFWGILCLVIIGYTDTLPALLGISDYLMTFHTAGYVALHGLWSQMYPPPGAGSFAGAPFDQLAHRILPNMPASSVGEYMYMPLSAYVFAPFAALSPVASMITWQAATITSTLASLYLCFKNKKSSALAAVVGLGAAFAFLPFTMTVWIGQVGIVFGLVPLALGFYLLRKQKYFVAGLVFSLLALKPQMLVPALFLIVFELAAKNWRPAAGAALGSIVVTLANYLLMGQSLCASWLNCLALSDKIYSNPAHGVAVHLATSLPRAILLSQPVASHAALKPVLYGASLILLLGGLAAAVKIASDKKIDREVGRTLAFALGALAMPIVVPHLFIYDLGALVPAGLMLIANRAAAATRVLLFLVAWVIVIDIYCIFLVVDKSLARPLVLVAIMLIFYLAAIINVPGCKIVGKEP